LRRRFRGAGGEGALCLELVAAVRALLDLATGAVPVLLQRVVTLHEGLQLEAPRRVADLLPAEHPEATIHVLAGDGGLDPLHAHEILLVQGPETLEAGLEVVQVLIEFVGSHGRRGPDRC